MLNVLRLSAYIKPNNDDFHTKVAFLKHTSLTPHLPSSSFEAAASFMGPYTSAPCMYAMYPSPKRKSSFKRARPRSGDGMEGRRLALESSSFKPARTFVLAHRHAYAPSGRTTYYFCRLWWKLESCATRRAIKMHTTSVRGSVTSAWGLWRG